MGDDYLDEIKECSHMSPSKIKDVAEEARIKAVPWIQFCDQIIEFCPCEQEADRCNTVVVLNRAYSNPLRILDENQSASYGSVRGWTAIA